MSTWGSVLAVGLMLVLPQVLGFAASRIGHRRSAGVWPLAAAGTVALYWAIFAVVDYHAAERARAAGEFRCGSGAMCVSMLAAFLSVVHFVVGSILGTLDRRARS
jgi:predicted Na+-dependent transporter